MKKRLLSTSILILLAISMVSLTQCDLILGSGGTSNVTIDLGDIYGDGTSRTVLPPSKDIIITGLEVYVFGPGMQPMKKTVTLGARYLNMSVPSGQDRHFVVEIFFLPGRTFPHAHVRSFIGRAIADLRPGMYTGLRFKMVAGKTQLLVPDHNNAVIYYAEVISQFASNQTSQLGYSGTFYPSDLEISASGMVFAANDQRFSGIVYADQLSGAASTISSDYISSIAMDKDVSINIDQDRLNILETSLLYLSDSISLYYSILDNNDVSVAHPLNPPSSPVQLNFSGFTINGMSVDPWTHRLYLVGATTATTPVPMLIEYDPLYIDPGKPGGRIVNAKTMPALFHTLQDVIVKDDAIFVLNTADPSDGPLQLPMVMKFDKNLNYLGGFGTISSINSMGQWVFVESVSTGKFYRPKRFFAHENNGLYIIDDSPAAFDKVVFINTDFDSSSWITFPSSVPGGDFFTFFDP